MAELKTILTEIQDENDPDGDKSSAVIDYWESLPNTLVIWNHDSLNWVLDYYEIPYPETFAFDHHQDAWMKLCGFDRHHEPQSFHWAGFGDLHWLIQFDTKGEPLETFLTQWVQSLHEEHEHHQ
ncbi:MAG: hypothetical protein RIS92_1570 [Verrucomicrobiota bacterium]